MGFHRTVLLKRAARFFFYCQKIIKVFLTIRVMPHKIEKSREEMRVTPRLFTAFRLRPGVSR